MKKVTTTPNSETETPAEPAAVMDGQMTEAMLSATDLCLKNMAIWQSEVADFTARRMKTNSKLLRSLPDCTNWDEVMSLQQGWLKTAGEDYIDETERLLGLSQRMMDGLQVATARDVAETGPSSRGQGAGTGGRSAG